MPYELLDCEILDLVIYPLAETRVQIPMQYFLLSRARSLPSISR